MILEETSDYLEEKGEKGEERGGSRYTGTQSI